MFVSFQRSVVGRSQTGTAGIGHTKPNLIAYAIPEIRQDYESTIGSNCPFVTFEDPLATLFSNRRRENYEARSQPPLVALASGRPSGRRLRLPNPRKPSRVRLSRPRAAILPC
jgi:hypothetical protein